MFLTFNCAICCVVQLLEVLFFHVYSIILKNSINPELDFMRIKSWNPISNQSEVILNTGEFGTAFSKTSVISATETQLFVGGRCNGIK